MLTLKDYQNLKTILDRASAYHPTFYSDRIGLMMDLEFANAVIQMDFESLASADDENFAHDVLGIAINFNRQTKTMDNCFVPRFARGKA